MKHTPAPWHMMETEPGIEAEMDVFVVTPRYAGGTGLIARVVNADDATLIASAPDLLAALQAIADANAAKDAYQDNGWRLAHEKFAAFARAAIAAATGRDGRP